MSTRPRRGRRPREHEPPLLKLVHGFDAVRFAQRAGLEPFAHPCHACGTPRESTLPFVQGKARGLMAPPCSSCGDATGMYCMLLEDFCR